ncbi:hypothetical protein [Parerythrobacter lacustris]|uniref:Uncharacterized protein n=1 Tax=Parerythrobacter lacustris TaxID=2969984 RepID=A0ABT1XR36_9SPHN|nr:hypothetical protein [Parerythrobacter lacustris]MCR2833729.1 hypothetical protein [Parerythrobacter lacustris]
MITDSKRIQWRDRDVGQKMSIIFGYLLFALAAAFMVYTTFIAAPFVEWPKLILAFSLGMGFNELIRRWRLHNAR